MRQPPTQLYMQNIASTSSYQPQTVCGSASVQSSSPCHSACQSVLCRACNVNDDPFSQQLRRRTILSGHTMSLLLLLLLIGVFPTKTLAEGSARCYFFGPGTTIVGSDYRRDYGIGRKACAETCKFDACCLAFEWRKTDEVCTLKSRSLNGTVEAAEDDTYFGLCLDYGQSIYCVLYKVLNPTFLINDDAERDRFWDHELLGPSIASVAQISRDKCNDMCTATMPSSVATSGTSISNTRKRRSTQPAHGASEYPNKANAVIYSWKTESEKNVDAMLGTCQCITVLHGVLLSFGSFSGFLV